MNVNTLPKSKGDKFKIINRTKIELKQTRANFNSKSSNVIVYSIFYADSYIRFAFVSIYFLIKNTDAEKFDIKIITDKKLSKKVKSIFEPIIGDNVIVSQKIFKHEAFNLLREKKNICFLDADSFFLSKKRVDVFQRIFNDDAVLMKPTKFRVKNEFKHRSKYWGWTAEQVDLFKKEWRTSDQIWHLAGFSNYPTKNFDQGFYSFLKWASEQNMYDDEALLLCYFFIKGITIHSIQNHIQWLGGMEALKHNGEPAFIHPFEGESYYSKEIENYFKKLVK